MSKKDVYTKRYQYEISGFLYYKTTRDCLVQALSDFFKACEKIGIATDGFVDCELRSKAKELFVSGSCIWSSEAPYAETAEREFHDACKTEDILVQEMYATKCMTYIGVND